ncbi:SDR family NAD(P)-dependent oxidoreductase [Hyphomonas pacifica]|uniref:Uncharacterized protein n=1 Tax=Hyphomonas pacifica TaxID=1280941 RepID=A0A062U1B8_9PROT|nr:SDR family NAD(P)-dependent oxidoreductase [Hyphomonas pacifica]KCZ49263.1 hypothetical protein HY2_15315 [Hyphomonas pacifica]RAN31900.1 hypothetical protein HY3_16100 [Hyphomonas pacifica]
MDMGFSGRTVVVTGATSGIGREVARLLLAEGAKLGFCSRSADKVKAARDQFIEEFPYAEIYAAPCNVLNPDAINAFASDVERALGAASVLVNNAGQGRLSTFETTTDEDWES